MENMKERIARGDINQERAEAIKVRTLAVQFKMCSYDSHKYKAMCDIAADRAAKLQLP